MLDVKIEKQDHFGNGITKLDEKLVFVEKALPDEIIKMELTDVRKNFSKARITEIIHPSPEREEVECKYYDKCGGCHILHQSYEKQLEFKVNKVNEVLNRIASFNINLTLDDIVSKNRYKYRNKIVLHNLGLYKEKSNTTVRIDECQLVNDKINSLIKILSKEEVTVKEVMIRTTSTNESLVVITGKISDRILNELLKNVTVLKYNDKYLTEKKFITECINEYSFKISPESFFQVNYEVMKSMYEYIVGLVSTQTNKNALDLYCGTGTIGILISKYVDKVDGVEIVKEAIIDASYNKKINNIENITFVCDKVENRIDDYKNIDLIIVDPPRSGLDKKTKETIKKIGPGKIIYVSCDPLTLARDISDLSSLYDVQKIKIFDMFPNTYHVECVCMMSRR